MNPYEDKLVQFASDEIMFNAVVSILYSHCDLNTLNLGTPTAELGPRAQAFLQAREILKNGVKELGTYKKKATNDPVFNPAV